MVGALNKIAGLTVGNGVAVGDFIKCIEKHGETKFFKTGETFWVKWRVSKERVSAVTSLKTMSHLYREANYLHSLLY